MHIVSFFTFPHPSVRIVRYTPEKTTPIMWWMSENSEAYAEEILLSIPWPRAIFQNHTVWITASGPGPFSSVRACLSFAYGMYVGSYPHTNILTPCFFSLMKEYSSLWIPTGRVSTWINREGMHVHDNMLPENAVKLTKEYLMPLHEACLHHAMEQISLNM